MDIDKLHQWSLAAAQELQEICDDAQIAAGNPDGEDQLPSIRSLMNEFDEINNPFSAESKS